MIFIDEMKSLKIYKVKTFLPTIEGDKKKHSALLLLTPSYQSTLKMMNYNMFINKLRFESYYFDKGVSYYINGVTSKEVDEEEDESLKEESYIKEADEYLSLNEMSADERNKLPDSAFGIPSQRKYPLDTEAHVKSAIRFFNYVDAEHEEELARNIIKAIKKFNMHPNVGKNNRFRKYYTPVNEFTFLPTPVDEENDVTTCDEETISTSILVNDSYYNGLNTGDKIIYFGEQLDSLLEAGESNRNNDTALRKILFANRMKKRKDVLLRYEQLKKDCPFIKYTYPELNKYKDRNVFVDLSYYMNIFLNNNTWTMMKGFNLFYEFMNRLINNPNLPGYSKKTIVIPVIDWDRTHDDNICNFRKSLSPMSIIYQLMYTGNEAQLIKLFGNHDVVFIGNNKYFKMNFKQMHDEGMDLKKMSSKFKIFVMKFAKNEEFTADDIDDSAEHTDSKGVLRAKVADKIEVSKGIDITPELHRATITQAKVKKAISADVRSKTQIKKVNTSVSKAKADETEQMMDQEKKDTKTYSKTTLGRDPMEDAVKSVSKVSKKQAVADTIEEIIDNVDSEEDVYNNMNDDDSLLDDLATLDSEDDGVDVSVGRSSRMSKLDEELMKKTIRGKTVEEILAEDTVDKKIPPLSIPVASPDKEAWSNMKYAQFDKGYNIQKDILKIIKHFTTTSIPIAIRHIDVKDNSTSEDRLDLYTVEMEDYRGKRFTIKLDIPIMVDNRFLIRGNKLAIQNQFFNMPILKTEAGVAQIISNYNKIFVYNRPRGSQ